MPSRFQVKRSSVSHSNLCIGFLNDIPTPIALIRYVHYKTYIKWKMLGNEADAGNV